MIFDDLCSPAILYIAFSITHIIIDLFKNMYNTAFVKFIIMIIFTVILNMLCQRGLGIISWVLVFVPFIMMTVMTTIILYVFGLQPAKGRIIVPPKVHKKTKRVTIIDPKNKPTS